MVVYLFFKYKTFGLRGKNEVGSAHHMNDRVARASRFDTGQKFVCILHTINGSQNPFN